jgi:hypothetical protein
MAKKSGAGKFMQEFVSGENKNYKVRIGSTIASSLAGVVFGAILASIIWYIALNAIISTM